MKQVTNLLLHKNRTVYEIILIYAICKNIKRI
jgi:hypothetical protein